MDLSDITKLFENDPGSFEQRALSVFYFQFEHNPLYRQYVDVLGRKQVTTATEIPFLPISFFKTHKVQTTSFQPEAVFESSGTTGMVASRHFVRSADVYESSFKKTFELFYGDIKNYCIVALLPSYLERKNSSLVHMADALMKSSGHPMNGFFLNNHSQLFERLNRLEEAGQKTLLIGVSFALLDFAEKFPVKLNHTIVMETGGMKGRRKELLRKEVHEKIKDAFQIQTVHSEYGMTELLSQAYSKSDGIFQSPPWMKILIREEDDPGSVILETSKPKQGGINVIDLANLYSCSFIETEDVGKLYPDGSFEVAGRLDYSDIRGCSLMVV